MRIPLFWLCAPFLLLVTAGTAPAQKKDVKKSEASVEPPLGGKTFSQWLGELKTTKDPSRSENAIRTILLFGADQAQEALPTLVGILRRHKPATAPIDTSVRVNAIIAIGTIVRNAKDRPENKLVEEAVTLLKRELGDEERIIRFRAAEALGNISLAGFDAKAAVHELVLAARDNKTWETRQAATFALGSVAFDKKKGPPQEVLEALYRALRDSSSRVRMTAVQSLANLGPPSQSPWKVGLEKALEPVAKSDPDPTVQIWAHMAVMSLNQKPEDWRIAAVAKMLQSPELEPRIQAAQALATLGKLAKKEVARLEAALNDPDPNVVGWSIRALGQMGADARPAVARLQKIASDPQLNQLLKSTAQSAIDAIEGRAKDKGRDKEAGK
jgi:HEAT repeat protein